MDSLDVPVATQETVAAAVVETVQCDGCGGSGMRGASRCGYCDGEGRRRAPLDRVDEREDDSSWEGDIPGRMAAWIDRRSEEGSYSELDRALAALRAADVAAHRDLLEAVDLELAVPAHLEDALRFVIVRMPDPVRVPKAVRANADELRERRTRAKGRGAGPALGVRDKEIRRFARQGRPVQWIAQEYGLSVRSVYAIVARGEVAA